MSGAILKGHILIVDDKPDNLRLLSTILVERGYRVRKAINGQLALLGVKADPPDLILLDITMPGMNGYDVCQQLKADLTTNTIPVIFISALDEGWSRVQAFASGGVDYITKPFQWEEVIARVETQMNICRLRRQLQEQERLLQQEILLRHQTEQELQKVTIALQEYQKRLESGDRGDG